MKVVQLINTIAASDGGPARNSFELNLALNRIPRVAADLVWIRGEVPGSVLADHSPNSLPLPGPRRLRMVRAGSPRDVPLLTVLRGIRSADIVLMHGYYLPWIPLAAMACRLMGTPYLLTPHGSLTSHQRGVARKKKAAYEVLAGRWLRTACAGFITGSRVEADELNQKFPSSMVAVGGVGTTLNVSTEKLDSASGHLRLLSVSRIATKKRIDLMIDAVAELTSMSVDVSLTIAGSGDDAAVRALHEHARRSGIDRLVTFVGEKRGDAKERLYEEADLFLLPSDDENFGIGLAEALAHGVPSIVSDKVAAAEAMTADAGVVLSSPTGTSIATAVVLFLDKSRLATARAAARSCAEDAFSWDRIAETWVKIFEERVPR